MKLTLISNSEPSTNELARYVRSCNEQKYQLPSRNDLHVKLQEVIKLKAGKWDANQIEEMVEQGLELKIKQGRFDAIADIPYEISRLSADLEVIRNQIQEMTVDTKRKPTGQDANSELKKR